MLITLNKLDISGENTDGTPRLDKNGNKYSMCFIEYTNQEGSGKASMFIGEKYGAKDLEVINQWVIGTQVNVIIEQSGKYTNFKIPNKSDLEIERIKLRLDRLEGKVGLDAPEGANLGSGGNISPESQTEEPPTPDFDN